MRVVGIETSRTESLTEEPSADLNDLAMPPLRTRETIISPCVGLAPSLNVCTSTRKKKNSPRVLGTHWVHTLGHLESTHLPASVAARSVSNCSQPFYSFAVPPLTLLPPPGSIRCLWVQKSISHKKRVHLGRNRLPTSETPATGSTAEASLLHKGSSDELDRTRVLCPADLVL